METSRNSHDRFLDGHKVSMPKGAISKNTRNYLAHLAKVKQILESSLLDDICSLSKKERVMFWMEIQKIKQVKLPKLTEPGPPKEQIGKITFGFVGANGKAIDDPAVTLVGPAYGGQAMF